MPRQPVKPLVVVTGQGIALADDFDLSMRIQGCLHLRKRPGDLDALFSTTRRMGEGPFKRLLQATRAICLKARESPRTLRNHTALFKMLSEVARDRVVIHLTTNIDGLTTQAAMKFPGSIWPPFRHESSICKIVEDIDHAFGRGNGLLHIPLHGEAGLAARGNGAPILRHFSQRGAVAGWNSTLAEGAGKNVRNIEKRMITSQVGYRLLYSLLVNEHVKTDWGFEFGPYGRAEVLIIGYGAGSNPTRCHYPLEAKIIKAAACGLPHKPATWKALLYKKNGAWYPKQSVRWYTKNHFSLLAYGDGDLVEVVMRALSSSHRGKV